MTQKAGDIEGWRASVSYKTSIVLCYSNRKNIVGDRENKKSMQKRKRPLPFEKLIFRNGQQVRDVDGKIYVAMTSILDRRTKKKSRIF